MIQGFAQQSLSVALCLRAKYNMKNNCIHSKWKLFLISSYQKAGCKASLSFGRIIRNLQGQEGDSKWQKKILRYFLESLYWEAWAGLFFHRRHFAKVQVGNFSNLFHIYTWVNWIRHFCHLFFSLRWFAHSFFQRATSKESFKKCSLTVSKMKS